MRRLLDEADVVTTPGLGFGRTADGYIRAALTVETPRLLEAVERIGKLSSETHWPETRMASFALIGLGATWATAGPSSTGRSRPCGRRRADCPIGQLVP